MRTTNGTAIFIKANNIDVVLFSCETSVGRSATSVFEVKMLLLPGKIFDESRGCDLVRKEIKTFSPKTLLQLKAMECFLWRRRSYISE